MTNEERNAKRKELERFYSKCPVVLRPKAASRWMPISINYVYAAIQSGELRSFTYKGGYIISKEDMIDYILDHCEDPCTYHLLRRNKRDDG